MGKLRFIAALWAAKLCRPLLRLLGRNATNFPGEVALKLCPDFLGRVGKPARIIAVTGTNGKTTVCNVIVSCLENMGQRVLCNRAGGNIASGIATTLAEGASLTGRAKYPVAVLEADERSALRIFRYITPELLAVTNLTRDSVMRNAHPAYIADILTAAIPRETKLVLNGDDLIAVGVAPENPRAYFAIDSLPGDTTELKNRIDDLRVCPKCAGELRYVYRRYHHIGKAVCARCGYTNPEADYQGTGVDVAGRTVTVRERDGERSYRLLSDSKFNIYNIVTAVAVLREFGFGRDEIAAALERTELPSSRFNAVEGGGVTAVMQMAKDKNAFAISRVFDYLGSLPGKKEIIMMNSCIEDHVHGSENVCWMYDCDFEFLNTEDITRIVVTGPRYKDFYMRLLMAGIPEERLRQTPRETDAPRELALEEGENVYILYGTAGIELAEKVQAATLREAENRREKA